MAIDERSFEVFGMPRENIPAGHYAFRADLDDLASGQIAKVSQDELDTALHFAARNMNTHQRLNLQLLAQQTLEGLITAAVQDADIR